MVAHATFWSKTQMFEQADGGMVIFDDSGPQPMQAQLAESVVDKQTQRFSRQPLAAKPGIGQGDTNLGVAVRPIQAVDVDQADQAALHPHSEDKIFDSIIPIMEQLGQLTAV
jgi:hypothetical protein